MVQNALGYAAHFCEAVKNTFNFSVPFLSWLAIIILTIVSIFLFFIPCRVIIMLWGINKFSRQLIMPNTEPNNELLDFLSRVPNDEMLKDSRELKLMHEENVQNKRPASKKRNWTMWCDIITFLCTLLLPLYCSVFYFNAIITKNLHPPIQISFIIHQIYKLGF